jgi:hypothetical protein
MEGILTQLNVESNKNKYAEALAVRGDDYLKYGTLHDRILLVFLAIFKEEVAYGFSPSHFDN